MIFSVANFLRPLAIAATTAGLLTFSHAASPTAVPTFECMSLYWDVTGGSPTRDCDVTYRAVGETVWKDAQPLWYDTKTNQYRGSVVNLAAGGDYEFKLELENGGTETLTASTWEQHFSRGINCCPSNGNQ